MRGYNKRNAYNEYSGDCYISNHTKQKVIRVVKEVVQRVIAIVLAIAGYQASVFTQESGICVVVGLIALVLMVVPNEKLFGKVEL